MTWAGLDPAKWAEQEKARMTALLRNSVQALAEEAGNTVENTGRVPVKSGNLARSVVVDDKPPQQDTEPKDRKVPEDITGGIAAIVPGKDVFIGWQAQYSRRLNYGFVGTDALGRVYNASGYGFAEAVAAKWPEIVIREATKMARR